MSLNNTLAVDIYALTTEQRQQLFITLFDIDPTVLSALNSEQRRRLYAVLIVIDPLLIGSAYSVVNGMTNEQVGSLIFYI